MEKENLDKQEANGVKPDVSKSVCPHARTIEDEKIYCKGQNCESCDFL